jgi:S-adenosylmethionine hydrolase
VGEAIDVESLTEPVFGDSVVKRERLATTVMSVDRFGNVRLVARPADLDAAGLPGDELSLLRDGARIAVRRVATFGALGMEEFGLVVDSAGWLAVVRNGSSAADALSLRRGDAVELHRAG